MRRNSSICSRSDVAEAPHISVPFVYRCDVVIVIQIMTIVVGADPRRRCRSARSGRLRAPAPCCPISLIGSHELTSAVFGISLTRNFEIVALAVPAGARDCLGLRATATATGNSTARTMNDEATQSSTTRAAGGRRARCEAHGEIQRSGAIFWKHFDFWKTPGLGGCGSSKPVPETFHDRCDLRTSRLPFALRPIINLVCADLRADADCGICRAAS